MIGLETRAAMIGRPAATNRQVAAPPAAAVAGDEEARTQWISLQDLAGRGQHRARVPAPLRQRVVLGRATAPVATFPRWPAIPGLGGVLLAAGTALEGGVAVETIPVIAPAALASRDADEAAEAAAPALQAGGRRAPAG